MAASRFFPGRGSTTSWRESLRALGGLDAPPWRTALSVGLGLAVGVLPVAPFQTLLVLGLAFLLRCNRVAAWTPTLIWQPFTAPFIVGAEVALGRWFCGGVPAGAGTSLWERWGWPLVVGSGILAAASGLAGAAATYVVLHVRDRQKAGPSVQQEGQG